MVVPSGPVSSSPVRPSGSLTACTVRPRGSSSASPRAGTVGATPISTSVRCSAPASSPNQSAVSLRITTRTNRSPAGRSPVQELSAVIAVTEAMPSWPSRIGRKACTASGSSAGVARPDATSSRQLSLPSAVEMSSLTGSPSRAAKNVALSGAITNAQSYLCVPCR